MTQDLRHETALTSALYVRGLGVVFALAFASLMVQVIGLVGAHGILPAGDYLAAAREQLGSRAFWWVPTWLWWTGASDTALRGLCLAGIACSLTAAAGRLPRIALFGAWSLYLSLSAVGQVFFAYQWDALLLESGLVGLFVTRGTSLGIWLARTLCFKLILLSGIVKLASGDPTWRDLSAMSFHFWTQPLPAWPAVLVDALPNWVKAGLTFATLAIELVVPLAIFGPRRLRLMAAGLLAGLQVAIAATGSYGFFNLLSLLLCASLLDDAALLALCPARLRAFLARRRAGDEAPVQTRFASARRRLYVALASAVLALSAVTATARFVPLPDAAHVPLSMLGRFRSINRYGLFAVMTTERREIALEGSADASRGARGRSADTPRSSRPVIVRT